MHVLSHSTQSSCQLSSHALFIQIKVNFYELFHLAILADFLTILGTVLVLIKNDIETVFLTWLTKMNYIIYL